MASLGKYALIQQLGTGSMGTVYLARDSVLDREVALKTIRTQADVEPELKERFYREARTCARLQHPNIVTIFDLGQQDDLAYIAMELLSGSDFRRLIQDQSSVDLVVKIGAIIQVCEALSYAHQQGIIHRDVKPSNLFLGVDNRAKVLDFGIARLPSSRLTVIGRVLGTPNYMAPEQILGKRLDGRSDLFSVAVVCFEVLVGQHPFQSALIPRRIVEGEPDSIFDHDSSIPLPFERIFERGFAKDPDRRYATGDEFASDLRAVSDGLRQNSSPRFSRFALPSSQAPFPAQPAETPILNKVDTQDTENIRLSEFLQALRGFDSAVESRDISSAEGVLLQLRIIGGADTRFAESIRNCQEKILQIALPPRSQAASDTGPVKRDPATGTQTLAPAAESFTVWLRGAVSATESAAAATSPERAADTQDVLCAGCSTPNRKGASYCVGCGVRLEVKDSVTNPPAPASVADPAPPPATQVRQQRRPGFELLTLGSLAARARVAWEGMLSGSPQRNLRMLVLAGIAICLALAISVYLVETRNRIDPYVAKAAVRMGGTMLYRTATNPKVGIASLPAGTRVDLLGIPESALHEWLLVEPVINDKAVYGKGYVDRAALEEWTAGKPDVALALADRLGPAEIGSDTDIQRQIDAFQNVRTYFPGTREARTAAMEEAGLILELARRQINQGQAETAWRKSVEHARSILAGLPSEPQIVSLIARADAMLASAPGSQTPADPQAPPAGTTGTIEQPPDPADVHDMERANELYSNYDYDGAISVLNGILARHPDNVRAQRLKSRVQDAKRTEDKTLR